jgi:hypothetical protein
MLPYRDVVRAKIVLMATVGWATTRSPPGSAIRREVVSKWRKRLFEQGPTGLEERPRVAGHRSFPTDVVVAVNALSCQLPSQLGVPPSRLHVSGVTAEVVSRGIVAEISGTTIWRWLSEDAIRPWRLSS